MGFSPVEKPEGRRAAPAVMFTIATTTMVSFNITPTSPFISCLVRPASSHPRIQVFETWTVRDNGEINEVEKSLAAESR